MSAFQQLVLATLASLAAICVAAGLGRLRTGRRVHRTISLVSAASGQPVIGAKLRDCRTNTLTFDSSDGSGCLPVPDRWGQRLRVDVVIRGRIVLHTVVVSFTSEGPFVIRVP